MQYKVILVTVLGADMVVVTLITPVSILLIFFPIVLLFFLCFSNLKSIAVHPTDQNTCIKLPSLSPLPPLSFPRFHFFRFKLKESSVALSLNTSFFHLNHLLHRRCHRHTQPLLSQFFINVRKQGSGGCDVGQAHFYILSRLKEYRA